MYADIIAELGITPQTLYGYFPTKRDLFAAAYREYLNASMSAIVPRLEDQDDPAVHLLWRMVGDYSLQALNPDLLYLSREAAYDDPDTTRQLRGAHEHVLTGPQRDLERVRRGPHDPPIPDELLSYARMARSRPCACARRGTTASPAATSCGPTWLSTWPSSGCTTEPSTRRPSGRDAAV